MKYMKPFTLIIFLLSLVSCQNSNKGIIIQPNVIFILVDDLGYSELNSYGNSFNETPNIDELAKNGLRFTNAYASAPVCSPFRASLMTGQHPGRLGITDYLRPHEDRHLDEEYTTIAEIFKTSGYHTGMIGKWHLSGYAKNGAKESGPDEHGFEEVILTEKRGISGGSYFYPYHFNQEVEQKIFPEEHLTDRLNLEAVEFIERNNPEKTGTPFFLYKSHYSAHTNLNGKHDYVKAFSEKEGAGLSPLSNKNNVHLAAQLKSVDDGVAMIKKELAETNQLDNTIIIVMSDNGGETNVTSNAPLRAGKSMVYEGGFRVPLIVWWPEMIKKPSVVDQPLSNMDFLSTFSELLGFDLSQVQVQDGKSMLGIWKDPEIKERLHESLYWHYPLEAPHFLGGFSSGAIRKGDFKLVEDYTSKQSFLYNLSEDIGEQNDLSEKLPELKSELQKDINDWRHSLNLEASGHTKSRKPQPEFPEPYGPKIELDIDGKVVPWINYGVDIDEDGVMYFDGKRNFLKLLHLYIPDVTAKSVELSANVKSECTDGVIIAHGEEVFGMSVYLKEGKLYYSTRKYGKLTTLKTKQNVNKDFSFKAVLEKNGDMKLFLDGQLVDSTNIGESLPIPPDDPTSIGVDFRRLIGEYEAENYFKGWIGDLKFIVN
jgi:arylsulfatase A-like enzyme